MAAIPLAGHMKLQHTLGQPSKTEGGCPTGREIDSSFEKQVHDLLKKINAEEGEVTDRPYQLADTQHPVILYLVAVTSFLI